MSAVKIDFFISPAYRVPPISTSFLPKWITMKVLAAGAVAGGIGLEVGGVEHREPRPEMRQLGRHRADEHVAHEQRVPRVGRDETDRNPVGRVGAAEEVLYVELTRVEIGAHVLVQTLERFGVEPGVLLPPDPVGGAGLLDDELVLGGAAGVGRGDGGERAVIGELSFTAAERVLDERRRRQIGVDPDREEAMLDEGEALARELRSSRYSYAPGRGARRRTRPAKVPAAAGGKYRQVARQGQPRCLRLCAETPYTDIGAGRLLREDRGVCGGNDAIDNRSPDGHRLRAAPPPRSPAGGRASRPSPDPSRSDPAPMGPRT